ncbi:hypothetical protein [Staphylococcus equorum]|uniref:hypothetical protein n=1 Tax=Staphylococcus equorum TaxID=246432 RepID=UPI003FD888BC
MSYNNDLFSEIDNVAQPQTLNDSRHSIDNNKTFFTHFSEVEGTLNDIQDELSAMNDLYQELGGGKIGDSLTIQRRNEIIDSLNKQQKKLEKITVDLNQYIEKDLISVRGLTVTTSTNVNAFDKLLKRTNEKKLTSKDVSFQRLE